MRNHKDNNRAQGSAVETIKDVLFSLWDKLKTADAHNVITVLTVFYHQAGDEPMLSEQLLTCMPEEDDIFIGFDEILKASRSLKPQWAELVSDFIVALLTELINNEGQTERGAVI